tara:strand:+ start:309 stop:566 length:258 start_codon:yes stop_codon:yes gene_type:complete
MTATKTRRFFATLANSKEYAELGAGENSEVLESILGSIDSHLVGAIGNIHRHSGGNSRLVEDLKYSVYYQCKEQTPELVDNLREY